MATRSRSRPTGRASPRAAGNASTIPGMHSEPDHYPAVDDDLPGSRPTRASRFADDDFGYDPDLDDALAVPGMAHAHGEERPQRRGLMVAAIVGGVALIGAIGAFALSSGGDDGAETVAIVKADDGPVKVKPENPGGTTVPNQDSKVYETVAGEGTTTDPQQQTLVTTAEEPADIEDDPVVAAKSEDRIEQILQETENQSDAQLAAVAPRKVRTMVVRPDGTLVPREETEAASDNLATDSVASAGAAVTEPVPDSTGALPAAGQEEAMATFEEEPSVMNGEPAEEPAAAVAEAPAPAPAVETAAAPRATDTPATAPIAPQRPAEQPIDVVGEVKPDQVASAATSARRRRLVDADRLAAQRGGRAVVLSGSRAPLRQRARRPARSTSSRPRSPARARSGASACRRSSRNDAISAVRELQGGRRQLLRVALDTGSRIYEMPAGAAHPAPVLRCVAARALKDAALRGSR